MLWGKKKDQGKKKSTFLSPGKIALFLTKDLPDEFQNIIAVAINSIKKAVELLRIPRQ